MKGLEKICRIKGKKFLFKVETSSSPRNYLKYDELRNEIWGDPRDDMAGGRNMKCENFFHEGSTLFTGVYAEDKNRNLEESEEHLIGFSYGFVGVDDKEIGFRSLDNLHFYSQYIGIKHVYQSYGLGVEIKKFQREILIDIFGIYKSVCTYDPLSGVNANRNIHHLGMEALEYREGYTGDFGGLLNRTDVPCDRFFVSWDLNIPERITKYDLDSLIESGEYALNSRIIDVEGRKGRVKLETVNEINIDIDQEFLLVEIPYDFYWMLKETDVPEKRVRNIPLDWRMKTRNVFQSLFRRGYKIIDFKCLETHKRRRNLYILKKA